jgi:hypothetical protein
MSECEAQGNIYAISYKEEIFGSVLFVSRT